MATSSTRQRAAYALFWAVLILLAAFWLRVNRLGEMPYGIHTDESTKTIWAWRWAAGYGMPYWFDSRPEPFDPMLRALWGRVAGLSSFVLQTYSIYLAMIAVAATYTLAKRLFRGHPQQQIIALMAAATLASIPANVILSRAIYRVNNVLPMMALAMLWIEAALRRPTARRWLFAGIFTGLTALFYPSGLFFFPVAGAWIVTALINDVRRGMIVHALTNADHSTVGAQYIAPHAPRQRVIGVFWYGLAVALVMTPWAWLFLTVPDWLGGRADVVPGTDSVGQAATLWFQAFPAIWRASNAEFENIRHNTFTAGLLNPVQVVLWIIGTLATFIPPLPKGEGVRGRGTWVILLALACLILPASLSGEPEKGGRLMGIHLPLALLVGLGAGTVAAWGQNRTVGASHGTPLQRRRAAVWALVIGFGFIWTLAHVRYHYLGNRELLDDPFYWRTINAQYHLGYHDFADYLAAASQPVYIPTEALTADLASLLRPSRYPTILGDDGGALPAGEILWPVQGGYDFPPMSAPVQFALFLPDSGTIRLLTPIPLAQAQALQARLEASPDTLNSRDGSWAVAYRLPVSAPRGTLADERPAFDGAPLGQFGGNFTLLGITAPPTLTGGAQVPVTLYWRLEQPTREFPFGSVQPYQPYSTGAPGFGALDFFYWFAPPPTWQAGEVMPITVWTQIYGDIPAGGYQWLVGVYTKPFDTFMGVQALSAGNRAALDGTRLSAARATVAGIALGDALDDATAFDAVFGSALALSAAQVTPTDGGLEVGLSWRVIAPPTEDYTLFIHWIDASGALISQADVLPMDNGRYPTGNWQVGQQITLRETLIPPATVNCPCQINAGWYTVNGRLLQNNGEDFITVATILEYDS